MTLIPQEIIRKKRDGGVLTEKEMKDFFNGFVEGDVSDYQMSAMLMAIYLNGINDVETAFLTKLSRDSGSVFSWSKDVLNVIDKHSTGGVGDKTSIVLLPLCLLEGVRMPMIAGKGLGHTGGTVDKLESIPGMNVVMDFEQCKKQMEEAGGFFMGQTEDIAAMDRRLYALRDVTSTVESIPLIVMSILSKKLAEGLDGLVMDVKFGTGAFMSTFEQANELAEKLVSVGKECGLKVKALLTSMNTPLGAYAGNTFEIYECLEIMRGRGPEDTIELILALATEMVKLAYPERDKADIEKRLRGHLVDGSCYKSFCHIVKLQGGDPEFFDNKDNFFTAKITKPAFASGEGEFINYIDVRALGMSIVTLGGGRKKVTDKIDFSVGLTDMIPLGSALEADSPVAYVHGNDEAKVEEAVAMVSAAYVRGNKKISHRLIQKTLG